MSLLDDVAVRIEQLPPGSPQRTVGIMVHAGLKAAEQAYEDRGSPTGLLNESVDHVRWRQQVAVAVGALRTVLTQSGAAPKMLTPELQAAMPVLKLHAQAIVGGIEQLEQHGPSSPLVPGIEATIRGRLQALREVAFIDQPFSPAQDTRAAFSTIRAQVEEAAKVPTLSAPYRALLEKFAQASLPSEPPFFVAAYYNRPHLRTPTDGEVTQARQAAIAEATAWLTAAA